MLASNRHCKLITNIYDSTFERGQSQKELSLLSLVYSVLKNLGE